MPQKKEQESAGGEKLSFEKGLYVVYPEHIQHFMKRFNLSALEMCNILGFPSVQEWYRLQKKPDERVKNVCISNLLRYYNEHPEELKGHKLDFSVVIDRIKTVMASRGAPPTEIQFALEQIFDKSEYVLHSWVRGSADPEQAALRVSRLIMKMSDEDLVLFLNDCRLGALPQVSGQDVRVYRTNDTLAADRRYSIQDDDQDTHPETISVVARRAPTPGRRRAAKDYPPAKKAPASIPHAEPQPADELEQIGMQQAKKSPWNR